MKERPIIFDAESVRAILAGHKRQTRRVIEPQPSGGVRLSPFVSSGVEDGHGYELRCRYGAVGDRLWVREALQDSPGTWCYVADAAPVITKPEDGMAPFVWAHHRTTAYCSPIHMPRWASRILLTITSVRVERVQDITLDDMRAEGLRPDSEASLLWRENLREKWVARWDAINGKRAPWDSNPFVWIIAFEVTP